jgi:hypothetical protein
MANKPRKSKTPVDPPPRRHNNRVWIELDKPRDAEHAKEICGLANKMLGRLLEDPNQDRQEFSWSAKDGLYIIIHRPYGTFQTCVDWGHWFNLDYLGRP